MMYYAIIVAAGKGIRTGDKHPKQFALLDHTPVVLHSMRAFHSAIKELEIIIVLNQQHQAYWEEIVRHYDVPLHRVVFGGEQRFDSVKNALDTIPHSVESLIAVHDAARPLISRNMIIQLFQSAEEKEAVVPGIMPADSVRSGTFSNNVIADRNKIYLIQTPQVFRGDIMKNAYHSDYIPEFTDDASVVEKSGVPIHIIEGEKDNFKITFPGDHMHAETILKLRAGNT